MRRGRGEGRQKGGISKIRTHLSGLGLGGRSFGVISIYLSLYDYMIIYICVWTSGLHRIQPCLQPYLPVRCQESALQDRVQSSSAQHQGVVFGML